MQSQSPPPDDPLATLAEAARKAVVAAEASRAAGIAAREAAASGRKRAVRAVLIVACVAILGTVLVVQGPRIMDPYHGVDPLADPQQAKAYVAALLDAVWDWRTQHAGQLPASLEQVVPQSRLLPEGSRYRLEYRVEGDVPVLVLQGGPEPILVRGAAR